MNEKKDLRTLVKENRKKNGYFAYLIYFFLALITSGIVFLNVFISSYFWLIFLVVCLPLMFAFERAVLVLREENVLSLRTIFSGVKTYFTSRFISTYSFFKTVIRTLLWGLLFAVLIFFIMYGIFKGNNILQFNDMVNEFISLKNLDSNAVEAIFNKYRTCVNFFMTWFTIAANFVIYLIFFHYINKHSTHLFMETSPYGDNPRYAKMLFRQFLKERRFEFLGKYFLLQWPLYLLFVIGMLLGGYLGSLYAFDGLIISTFALAIGLLLSIGLCGGFTLANKEALVTYFLPSFKKLEEENNKRALEQIKQMAEYNAQREAFLKQMREQWNSQNQNKEIEDKSKEDEASEK